MKILIVDDSKFICLYIKQTLEKAGYKEVYYVSSALEAFELLGLENPGKEVKIDLILMDLVMPDIDGIEACSRIKSAEHLKDIPLIIITEKAEDKFLEAAFNAGAMDFITKPLRKIVFLSRIRSALTLKKEMDRRKEREKELLKVTRLFEDANKRLQELTFQDALTGIANRRCFEKFLDKEWLRARRNNMPIALIMLDIDIFKAFNDNYGHLAGDECLKQVAQVLQKKAKRPGVLAARFGGEEFAIVLPETGLDNAALLAEDIRGMIEDLKISHIYSPVKGVVTVSLGVAAIVPDRETSATTLIEYADRALYLSKQMGRNQINTYPPRSQT